MNRHFLRMLYWCTLPVSAHPVLRVFLRYLFPATPSAHQPISTTSTTSITVGPELVPVQRVWCFQDRELRVAPKETKRMSSQSTSSPSCGEHHNTTPPSPPSGTSADYEDSSRSARPNATGGGSDVQDGSPESTSGSPSDR